MHYKRPMILLQSLFYLRPFLQRDARSLFEQPQQSPQGAEVPSTIVPDDRDSIWIHDIPLESGGAAGSVFHPVSASKSNIELRYMNLKYVQILS
jgi:hypothetical protein